MSRVAVIGCGLFGASVALKTRERGHDVVVFERLPQAIAGASYNNMGRLHLGFHYPRDRQTARQCIDGFRAFRSAFPGAVVDGFPNAYFIAAEHSRTTGDQFLAFCDDMELPYRRVDPSAFAPPVDGVALGITTDEVVYDAEILRREIVGRMDASGIEVRYATDIVAAHDRGCRIDLVDAGGRRDGFDAAVNATYANTSRIARSLGLPVVERQFEYVAVPIVAVAFARVGITVMDGNFVSLLPFGTSDCHTLYHVEHSVLATSVTVDVDAAWLDKATSPFARCDAKALFERIRSASARFVPALADAELVGFLHGPRAVLAGVDDTDARPSIVDRPLDRYVSLMSGKADHCTWVAEAVADELETVL